MCCGTEAGSYLRLIDSCITQVKAQGPSRTCNERKEKEGLSGTLGRWDGTIWLRCHALQPEREQREEIALLVVPRPVGALTLQVPPSRSHSRQPDEISAAREQTARVRSQRIRIQSTPMNHPALHSTPLPALPLPLPPNTSDAGERMGGMLHPHACVVCRWLRGREEVHQGLRVSHRRE